MMNGSIDNMLWELSDLISNRQRVEAAALWQRLQGHPELKALRAEIEAYKPTLERVDDYAGHAAALEDSSLFWQNPAGHASFWAGWKIPF